MKWWHCFRSYGWGWLSSSLRSGGSRCIGEVYRARRVPIRCVPQTCDSACCFTLAGDEHSTGREQVDVGAVHLNESPAGKVSTALSTLSAASACASRQRAQCVDKQILAHTARPPCVLLAGEEKPCLQGSLQHVGTPPELGHALHTARKNRFRVAASWNGCPAKCTRMPCARVVRGKDTCGAARAPRDPVLQ